MEKAASSTDLTHPFCTHCGEEVTSNWKFCPHCGHLRVPGRRLPDARALTDIGLAVAVVAALMLPHWKSSPPPAPPAPEPVVLAPVVPSPVVPAPIASQPTPPVAAVAIDPSPVVALKTTVPADHWIDTGIDIKPGSTFTIHASGHWNPWNKHEQDMGPDGHARSGTYDVMCPDANWGSLVGRIGSGPYFPVGSERTITDGKGGRLTLGVNDDFDSGATQDNIGSLDVTINGEGASSGDAHPFLIPWKGHR